MPISLLPVSRRRYLGTMAALAACSTAKSWAEEMNAVDPHRFALLADTHIPSDPTAVNRKTNTTDNLNGVVDQLIKLERRPAATFIFGDLAMLAGEPGDYKLLGETLKPLTAVGLPIHMALGNHDHRPNCLAAFPANDADVYARVERRVAIIESPRANWFVLDSLDKVNGTPGLLGEMQLKWLAEALDKHADKPALIGVHHHMTPKIEKGAVPGLVDTPALYDVIAPRKQVKAVFFGHTHSWGLARHEGIHLVNLPPVAYVFAEGKPNGWVDCRLAEQGVTLEMRCHDSKHKQHDEKIELAWRT